MLYGGDPWLDNPVIILVEHRKENQMSKTTPETTPKTYKGKSMKLGGGGRFSKLKDSIMKKSGVSEETAKAIAANMGRKSLGKSKMASLAAKGKARAEK